MVSILSMQYRKVAFPVFSSLFRQLNDLIIDSIVTPEGGYAVQQPQLWYGLPEHSFFKYYLQNIMLLGCLVTINSVVFF